MNILSRHANERSKTLWFWFRVAFRHMIVERRLQDIYLLIRIECIINTEIHWNDFGIKCNRNEMLLIICHSSYIVELKYTS